VRRHDFFSKPDPVPEKNAQDQRRPTRAHVDDCPTGKIDRSDFGGGVPNSIHPSIDSPDHVRDGKIDDKHPDPDKNEDSCEFHPLSDCTDD
jgi:hypothetical protein